MRLRIWLAVQALVTSINVAGSDFVTSLHSNFVVNLDFEADRARGADEGDSAAKSEQADKVDPEDVKVMSFAGGKRKFRCTLPSGKNRTSSASRSEDAAKSRSHFIAAKLASMRGSCWKYQKDYWSYDICFGRRITQYRPDEDTRFSLGQHVPERDELLSTGGIREFYTDGTENRTSEVRFVCGSAEQESRVFKVEEPAPLYYVWTVSGPSFCVWNENDGSQARDMEGGALPVSALLEELRGSCVNVTQGWWTYEYCYPRQLVQFHVNGNGGKRDPLHVLGKVDESRSPTEVNSVEMSMVRLKPSMSARERRAPPSQHLTLRQSLVDGAVCHENNRARSTMLHFQCPPNWQSRPEIRIVSITEGSLCEYDVMIHTPLLCGHEKLLPTMPRGRETIQCVAEPEVEPAPAY